MRCDLFFGAPGPLMTRLSEVRWYPRILDQYRTPIPNRTSAFVSRLLAKVVVAGAEVGQRPALIEKRSGSILIDALAAEVNRLRTRRCSTPCIPSD